MGHLGQHRCIFVYDRLSPIKLPSDLFGVAVATFETRPDGNLTAALEPICFHVQTMVSKVGLRAQILKFTHRELQTNSSLPDLSGEWADEQNNKVTIQQFGSFLRGTIMIYRRGSERELDFEGKFTTGGQLVMFFQDRKGRGFIVGTIILHLTSDLSLRGQSIYYDHTKDMVISKARLLQRL